MADDTERSDQPIVLSETDIGTAEGARLVARRTYIPPMDGSDDDYAEFDMQVATGIGMLLNKHYFGYRWKSFADTRQGIVGFQIPSLMGPTLHYVINLKQYSDLNPQLIIEKAGELLERMNLPRGKADMARVLEAEQRKETFDFGKIQ